MTTYSGGTINSDANGNTINRTSITAMSYNNANRLSQATASSTTTSYQYSGLGWRNLKTGAKTIHYDYLPDGKTLSQMQLNTDGSYNTGFDYVWLDDMPIAQIKTVYTTNNTPSTRRLTYIHVDHLNTPRLMTDANKTVVWKWSADAYGLLAPNTNPDGDSIVDTLDLRMPGQIADSETGLFYNLNRYFDPAKGGYTQADPIGPTRDYSNPILQVAIQAGLLVVNDDVAGLSGLNQPYTYVLGNPLRYIDPTGLSTDLFCDDNLRTCRLRCGRRPQLSGPCLVKCEEQYGALGNCQPPPPPKKPEQCPPKKEDPKPDPLTPDCTYEKWRAKKC